MEALADPRHFNFAGLEGQREAAGAEPGRALASVSAGAAPAASDPDRILSPTIASPNSWSAVTTMTESEEADLESRFEAAPIPA